MHVRKKPQQFAYLETGQIAGDILGRGKGVHKHHRDGAVVERTSPDVGARNDRGVKVQIAADDAPALHAQRVLAHRQQLRVRVGLPVQ